MKFLKADDVLLIHEQVINPKELQGLAGDKSLESVIARVDNRIHYGLISDVYELAACYAVYIAVGHVFNDANKRTAFAIMKLCLDINGVSLKFETETVSQMIIQAAQGIVDEAELATWLRGQGCAVD